jgi:hypothetical protein
MRIVAPMMITDTIAKASPNASPAMPAMFLSR